VIKPLSQQELNEIVERVDAVKQKKTWAIDVILKNAEKDLQLLLREVYRLRGEATPCNK
jgi:hypothetical protein